MIGPKLLSDAPKTLTPTARKTVWTRQKGLCPWCGNALSEKYMAAHHRLLRSAGGSWSLSNIVGLHAWCHNVQPKSVHQEPKRAYRLGFMIRTKQITPSDIPLHDRSFDAWFLLNSDGSRDELIEDEAMELMILAGVS